MSPFAPGWDAFDVDWDAVREIPVLVQHGTEDPMIPVRAARDLTRVLAEHGRAGRVRASTRWDTRSRSRACATRTRGSTQVLAGERPSEPLPEPPPEGPVKTVTTASFDAEVLRSDVPGDRRLLGAVVRTVQAGRPDRRADRARCARAPTRS